MTKNKAIRGPALWSTLLFSMLICSCATIKGKKQVLLIPTDVQSVDVFLANGTYLGTGPGFVEVPRQKYQSLKLTYERQNKVIPLQSQYRWGDSFWPSLLGTLFIPYLGVASFITDYVTGAAWEYRPVRRVEFNDEFNLANYSPQKILVTPAQFHSELLSDEVSAELVGFIGKRYPKATVLSYEGHQPLYSEWGWTYESFPGHSHREQLYSTVKTDHVLNTQIEQINGRYLVRSQLYDIHRNEVRDKFVIEKKGDSHSTTELIAEGTRSFLYELVPNAIGIERLNYQEAKIADVEDGYVETVSDQRGWLGTQLGFGLANLRAPQVSGTLDPYFDWRSKGSLFYRRLDLVVKHRPDQTPLFDYDPTEVTWYGGLLGVGPEVGLDTPIGLFYLQIIPTLDFNYVSTDAENFKNRGEFRIGHYSEIGYGLYLTNRIYFQLFTGNTKRPQLFKEAIEASYQSLSKWNDSSMVISGVSLSYFFPEGRSEVKKMIREF